MSTVLERAKAAEQKNKAEAAQAYLDLVTAAAHGTDDGSDPTPVLRAVGKTAADLATDASQIRNRIEARERIAAAKAGSKRHAAIMASMEESAARLRAEEQRHQQHCWPLHAELRDIASKQIAVMEDERFLRETASDEVKTRARVLQSQLTAAGAKIEQIRGTLERLGQMKHQASRALTARDQHEMLKVERDGSMPGSGNVAEVARIQKRIEAVTQELRDAEAHQADIMRQRDENSQQHLED